MILSQVLEQRTHRSRKVVFVENIDQKEVSDHNQGATSDNSIKGFTLFFAEIEHLFAVLKEDFNGPSAGIVSKDFLGI